MNTFKLLLATLLVFVLGPNSQAQIPTYYGAIAYDSGTSTPARCTPPAIFYRSDQVQFQLCGNDFQFHSTGGSGNLPLGTGLVVVNNGVGATINPGVAGHYARSNGSQYVDSAINAGDVPVLNQNTTGNASTATALASAPTTCSTGQASTGVDVRGNAQGCFTPSGQTGVLCTVTISSNVATWPNASIGGAGSVPCSGYVVTLNQNVTSTSGSGAIDGLPNGYDTISMIVIQDATGGRTLTYPSNVISTPVWGNNAGTYLAYNLQYNGSQLTGPGTTGDTLMPAKGAPSSNPPTGYGNFRFDSVNLSFHGINASGTDFTVPQTTAATAHNWIDSILVDGTAHKSQPAASDLSNGTTGSGGGVVLATSPALTTPNLGTPSAVNLTNGTALPLTGLSGAGAAGHIPRSNGSNYVDAQLGASDLSNGVSGSGAICLSSGSACGGGSGGGGALGYSDAGVAFSSTMYFPPVGGQAPSATEANVQWAAPAAATLANFQVQLGQAVGGGNTVVFTVRSCTPSSGACTGIDRALTCTVSGASAVQCQDNTAGHNFNVAQGDLISIKAVTTGTVVVTPTVQLSVAFGTSNLGVTSVTGDGALITNSSSVGPAVTLTLGTAGAHKVWMNNTGSTAAPGYQSIGLADLPVGVVNTGTAPVIGSSDTLNCSTTPNITTTFQYFATQPTLPAFTQTAGAAFRVHFNILQTYTGSSTSIMFQLGYGATPTVLYSSSTAAFTNTNLTNSASEFIFDIIAPIVTSSGTLDTTYIGGTSFSIGSMNNATAPVTFDTTSSPVLKLGMKCTSGAQAQIITVTAAWIERLY